MCVILVCPDGVRPDRDTLAACHECNPHGAGVAWREKDGVRWMKGLGLDEVESLVPDLPGEIVVHFRIASVGEVVPALCHPFPVTHLSTTRLTGRARAVLFHNGTWLDWRQSLRWVPVNQLTGPLSDSRVAAILAERFGPEVLDRLPGRYVFFERDFTLLYGEWHPWAGMQASNLGFTGRLPKRRAPSRRKPATLTPCWDSPCLPLDFEDGGGTSDT